MHFQTLGSLNIYPFQGGTVMLGTWERKGVGFLQSRGSFHPTPRRN